MKKLARSLWAACTCLLAFGTHAAPDEAALGRAQGYPAGTTPRQYYEERYRVGSFSATASWSPYCTLAPAAQPLPLEAAARETSFHYRYGGQTYTLDDYMQHQRATAVLVLKDGQIVAERYNYARTAQMRMLSNSMAKTLVALAIGQALQAGQIRTLDDTAATYAPELAGTLYGETRIVDLLRMASGARYIEDYSGHDDRARFNAAARRDGIAQAAKTITERADPPGQRFNYGGAQTEMLGLVLRGATHQSLCEFVDRTLWQPLGAQTQATWLLNPADRVEIASGAFNATVRDYARLGWLMANDGQVQGRIVVPREYLLDMTDAARQPPAFRPGTMRYHDSTYYGYGLQTWLFPGSHRRFALLGVYGQAIMVDPELKLVVVHTAVGRDAAGDASGTHLGAERTALFRGIVATYGPW
jgi:CubicO group peptidase (beta-lactamase class C family)